jgi:hypothetical protein
MSIDRNCLILHTRRRIKAAYREFEHREYLFA